MNDKMSTKNKFLICLVLIQLVIGFSLALAEEVTFKVNLPNENNIKVGDTFEVQILLDIASDKAIKSAEFVLTPTGIVSFTDKSAVSGNLFPGATVTYNALIGSGYKYGETNTATEVSGAGKLLVTLKAKANAEGSATFTFSNLLAKKGNFARTTTSVSKVITVKAAAIDCAIAANCADFACVDSPLCEKFCESCDNECALIAQQWTCVDCSTDSYCGLGSKCENYKCVSKDLPPESDCGNGIDDDEDDSKDCEDSDCTANPLCVVPVCGDGILQVGEACDDKNVADKDGCSKTCQTEPGWSCGGINPCLQICTDTDQSSGLSQKGTATGFLDGVTYGAYTDNCEDTVQIIEYSCETGQKGMNVLKTEYTCPNQGDCKEGACVAAAGFKVETTNQETYTLLTAIRDNLDALPDDANTLQKISAIASALKTYF